MTDPIESPSRTLRVSEIFLSIQGEANSSGWPTVFVRLTGCPLRCNYCDTEYAFRGGTIMEHSEILEKIRALKCARVCVTGGEPLAQGGCGELLQLLCDAGMAVSLETCGALSIDEVDPRVEIVMDLKGPSSGEVSKNLLANLERLKPQDQIKMVLADRLDYEWAQDMVLGHHLSEICTVLFSAVAGSLEPRQLAEWILEDQLNVRFQMQLHRLLWGDESGR